MKQTLSVVITVHKENDILRRILERISFADEIKIIDNNSGIIWKNYRKYQISIIQYPNIISDFSVLKNFAISKCKSDWVLLLDSDEIPSNNLKQEFNIIANNNYDLALVKRTDYFHDKALHHGEAANVWLPRLFKKGTVSFEGKVHEVVKQNTNIQYPISNIQLSHYPHHNISSFLDKILFYAKLRAEERRADNLSRTRITFELLTFPLGKFLHSWILSSGFRDGFRGLTYATLMSLHSLFVRIFLLIDEKAI